MQNKKLHRTISIVLFFIGAFLIINEQADITGAVIGFSRQPGFSAILGFCFIIGSLILFMAGSIEEEVFGKPLEHIVKKYDPKIKSFRRWLEKDLHKKFSYEQAEETYRDVEKKYWSTVETGIIKHKEGVKKLRFIEDYIEKHKKGTERNLSKKSRNKISKIGDMNYDNHSIDRMEERGLFPNIVNDVVKNGECYNLKNKVDLGEAKGATTAYIKMHTADILPGGKEIGRSDIGNRIITVNPKKEREFKNIIVLTDKNNTVKTMYVRNDKDVKKFLNTYVN